MWCKNACSNIKSNLVSDMIYIQRCNRKLSSRQIRTAYQFLLSFFSHSWNTLFYNKCLRTLKFGVTSLYKSMIEYLDVNFLFLIFFDLCILRGVGYCKRYVLTEVGIWSSVQM